MSLTDTVPTQHPRTLIGIVALFCITGASPLLGQQNCGALAHQQAMNACFAERARRSVALLDSLIHDLHGHLQQAQYAQLLNVQRDWTQYRDGHCKWQAHFAEGGSIQPTEYAACIDVLTWNRIDDLKLNLCEGNGMTGACTASAKYDRVRRQGQHK
jgi:uncharacterized protein YecT (DUF1311 family)